MDRREFLVSSVSAGALASVPISDEASQKILTDLDEAATAPVLEKRFFTSPVKIASIELLKNKGYYFLRTRSADGAEGISVPSDRVAYLFPILQKLVVPFFIGKDARGADGRTGGAYVDASSFRRVGVRRHGALCLVHPKHGALPRVQGRCAGNRRVV